MWPLQLNGEIGYSNRTQNGPHTVYETLRVRKPKIDHLGGIFGLSVAGLLLH
jgi:hypothetical protein